MQTSGTESIFASAMPVTRLVAPGPLVAIATPVFPVARAYPSAANTAPCSCRVRMCRTPLPFSASYSGMIAPPGYPNTRSTPSARKQRKTMSAPLSIHDLRLMSCHRFGFLRFLFSWFFRQPRHHAAQTALPLPQSDVALPPRAALQNSSLRCCSLRSIPWRSCHPECAPEFLHCRASRIADDSLAPRQVAILSGVGNRMSHPAQAAFVDQIYDQLHFMQAFKVSNFWLIACRHEGLKAFLDEGSQTAAQNCLLAEKVGFRFFFETWFREHRPAWIRFRMRSTAHIPVRGHWHSV